MPLRGFLVERLVGVLPVDVYELRADVFELGEGGGLVVDVAAAFAFDVYGAADGKLAAVFIQQALFAQLGLQGWVFADVKQGGKLGFVCACADLAVIGFVAQQQGDGVQRDGFARACFAGEHGEAVLEVEVQFFYDDEVLQGKGEKHGDCLCCEMVGWVGARYYCI